MSPPVTKRQTTVRHHTVHRMQRFFALVSLAALVGLALVAARIFGLGGPGADGLLPQGLVGDAFDKQVALISGHAGFDSGAVCEDAGGQAVVTEASINAEVARRAAARLRRAGADVIVLEEYDARLEGLRADVLLSLHADSCIEASGYKAAVHEYAAFAETAQQLLACIDTHYPAAAGLPHHPDTVTHDMTGYHAFNRIDARTPAAILELGFLGGDQKLLVERPELAAKGVADSVLCFLRGPQETPTP